MKKLLSTLYIFTEGTYVSAERQKLIIHIKGKKDAKRPISLIQNIVCFGLVNVSVGAMELCAQNNVTIAFLNIWGRYVASFTPPVYGNILLRREQFRQADDLEKSTCYARNMIAAKISNSRKILQRAAREGGKSTQLKVVIDYLKEQMCKVRSNPKIPKDILRGIEGNSAVNYFSCFDDLILSDKKNFYFHGRTRRPPTDRVNALLSFCYSLLITDMASALFGTGLDPYVGFLHTDRSGRWSLALDMIEELRYLADRFVLRLINKQEIKADDFTERENGAVYLKDGASRRKFFEKWWKFKRTEITHPFLKKKVQYGLLPHIQAMLLARAIRGEEDAYPPFFLVK